MHKYDELRSNIRRLSDSAFINNNSNNHKFSKCNIIDTRNKLSEKIREKSSLYNSYESSAPTLSQFSSKDDDSKLDFSLGGLSQCLDHKDILFNKKSSKVKSIINKMEFKTPEFINDKTCNNNIKLHASTAVTPLANCPNDKADNKTSPIPTLNLISENDYISPHHEFHVSNSATLYSSKAKKDSVL